MNTSCLQEFYDNIIFASYLIQQINSGNDVEPIVNIFAVLYRAYVVNYQLIKKGGKLIIILC